MVIPLFLYATVFETLERPKAGLEETREEVLGITSLVFWTLTLLFLIKYVVLILRADDRGEGGSTALFAKLCRRAGISPSGRLQATASEVDLPLTLTGSPVQTENPLRTSGKLRVILTISVMVAASFVIGDGALLPALSVISSMEGIAYNAPGFTPAVIPVSCVLLLFLFIAQRIGSQRLSIFFAPVTLLWFFTLAALGIYNISLYPDILRAISPAIGLRYLFTDFSRSFHALPGIILSVAGVELVYADLGHFSRHGIQLSASFVAYPALVLTYLGQPAQVLYKAKTPVDIFNVAEKAFWASVPKPIYWPVVVLSTLVMIVGSQAAISATTAIVYQSTALEFLPRLRVQHTSRRKHGYIYIPALNVAMGILSILLVIIFQNHYALAAAFGVAIAITMLLTDITYSAVVVFVWAERAVRRLKRVSLYVGAALFGIFFGAIDLLMLASVLPKIANGGWAPLAIGALVGVIMGVWRWGNNLKARAKDVDADRGARLEELLITAGVTSGPITPRATPDVEEQVPLLPTSSSAESIPPLPLNETPLQSYTSGKSTSEGSEKENIRNNRAISFATNNPVRTPATEKSFNQLTGPVKIMQDEDEQLRQSVMGVAITRSKAISAPNTPRQRLRTTSGAAVLPHLQLDIGSNKTPIANSLLLMRTHSASNVRPYSNASSRPVSSIGTATPSMVLAGGARLARPLLPHRTRSDVIIAAPELDATVITRTPGMAFFFSSGDEPYGTVPLVFRHFLARFSACPERVVFIHQIRELVPFIPRRERVRLLPSPAVPGFWRCEVHLGYLDKRVECYKVVHAVRRWIEDEEMTSSFAIHNIHDDTSGEREPVWLDLDHGGIPMPMTPLSPTGDADSVIDLDRFDTRNTYEPESRYGSPSLRPQLDRIHDEDDEVTIVLARETVYAAHSDSNFAWWRRFWLHIVYRALRAINQEEKALRISSGDHGKVVEIGLRLVV